MNRGIYGRSKANGQGVGLQRWTLGFDYADGKNPPTSSISVGVSGMQQFARRIVPGKSCLLTSIDAFIAGNNSNVQKIEAAVADEAYATATPKPNNLIGISSYGGAASGGNAPALQAVLDATPRWTSVPMCMWLKGGVPVWLIVKVGNGCALYAQDYAGGTPIADCYEQNASDTQGYFVSELNITWVQSTTKLWAIRGSMIA